MTKQTKQRNHTIQELEDKLDALAKAEVDLEDNQELAKHGIHFSPTIAVSCRNKECESHDSMWGLGYDEVNEKPPGYHKDFVKTKCPYCKQYTLYQQ